MLIDSVEIRTRWKQIVIENLIQCTKLKATLNQAFVLVTHNG